MRRERAQAVGPSVGAGTSSIVLLELRVENLLLIERAELRLAPGLNVLTGELSLVGPRPTLLEQIAEYDDFEKRRLLLKPGVTGWAQVSGGIYLPWEERIALDVWYVDNWSLGLDFETLVRTVGVILSGEKLNQDALTKALALEQDVYAHGAVRVGG